MELDFSALSNISAMAEQQTIDSLIDPGAPPEEELPFKEPQESSVSRTPAQVEIKQIFSLSEAALLVALYDRGRIHLLDKLRVSQKTGTIYAHFLMTLEEPHN